MERLTEEPVETKKFLVSREAQKNKALFYINTIDSIGLNFVSELN